MIRVMIILSTILVGASSFAATPECSASPHFFASEATLEAIHVFTGEDGQSHLRKISISGATLPFLNSGLTFSEIVLGPSLKNILVAGPANQTIPVRTGLGRVMFLLLRGSTTVVLPDGSEATATPGMLTIFDDAESRTGHGGRTGPCGYVALSMPFPPDAPTFAPQP